MKSADELRKAFAVYYAEMDRCQAASAYWALLHLVIVIPDICAALESSATAKVGGRYIDWCAAHFPNNPRLTPGDRFQMRNALLHEGTTFPTNRAADAQQHCQYSSFSFVEPGAASVEVHQNISPDGTNLDNELGADLRHRRRGCRRPVSGCSTDSAINARVEQNLSRLARQQQKESFVPTKTPTGIVVVTHLHNTTSST